MRPGDFLECRDGVTREVRETRKGSTYGVRMRRVTYVDGTRETYPIKADLTRWG